MKLRRNGVAILMQCRPPMLRAPDPDAAAGIACADHRFMVQPATTHLSAPYRIRRAVGCCRSAAGVTWGSTSADCAAPGPPGGLPLGGATVLALSNDHLSYALTWFGLALGLAGVFAAFAAGRLRTAAPAARRIERPDAPC